MTDLVRREDVLEVVKAAGCHCNPDGQYICQKCRLASAIRALPPARAKDGDVERLRDGLESAANALDAIAVWVREKFCLEDAANDIDRDAKQAWYALEQTP